MALAQSSSNASAPSAVMFLVLGLGSICFLLSPVLMVAATLFFAVILHRAWQCLQAASPRTTPDKAACFLFIPLFNLYWMFVAIAGLPKEWNRIIASHPDLEAAPKLNGTLFLLFCIGWFVYPPLSITLMIPMVFQMCKGINFFAARQPPFSRPPVRLNGSFRGLPQKANS